MTKCLPTLTQPYSTNFFHVITLVKNETPCLPKPTVSDWMTRPDSPKLDNAVPLLPFPAWVPLSIGIMRPETLRSFARGDGRGAAFSTSPHPCQDLGELLAQPDAGFRVSRLPSLAGLRSLTRDRHLLGRTRRRFCTKIGSFDVLRANTRLVVSLPIEIMTKHPIMGRSTRMMRESSSPIGEAIKPVCGQ